MGFWNRWILNLQVRFQLSNDQLLSNVFRQYNVVMGLSPAFYIQKKTKPIKERIRYTVEKKGDFLLINAGYSHPIYLQIPENINIEVPSTTSILVKGISKQNVGDVAAKIRQIRKPEPYKGKGIKYSDERIRRKAGKTVGAGAA